jgi:hypothetical protein
MSNINTRPLTFNDSELFTFWHNRGIAAYAIPRLRTLGPYSDDDTADNLTRLSMAAYNAGFTRAHHIAVDAEHRAYSNYRNGVTRDHYTAEIAGWSDPTEYDWDYTDNV